MPYDKDLENLQPLQFLHFKTGDSLSTLFSREGFTIDAALYEGSFVVLSSKEHAMMNRHMLLPKVTHFETL